MARSLVAALDDHLAGAPLRIPAGGNLVFGWFVDLCRTRTYHAAGPHPISFAEIEAYARLQRWPLEPRHVALLRELDAVWMKRAAKPRSGAGLNIPRNAPALTAAAFDAVTE